MPIDRTATRSAFAAVPRAVVRVLVALALLVALGLPHAAAAGLNGRVVAVHDGDTITVLVERREVRVRLAGIDAPEQGQPYASAARRALGARVRAQPIAIDVRGSDGYGRTLGIAYVGGVNVNEAQVRDGWAWVFRRYASDPMLLAHEDEARRARRGLWRDPHPVAPWVWRQRHASTKNRPP